jgi:hypothetical protein
MCLFAPGRKELHAKDFMDYPSSTTCDHQCAQRPCSDPDLCNHFHRVTGNVTRRIASVLLKVARYYSSELGSPDFQQIGRILTVSGMAFSIHETTCAGLLGCLALRRETGDEYATGKRFIYRRNQISIHEHLRYVA